MSMQRALPLLIISSVIVALVFLSQKTRIADPHIYNRIISDIQQLIHHDELLNQTVLQARKNRYSHYDQLLLQEKEILDLLTDLKQGESDLYYQSNNLLYDRINQFEKLFTKKVQRIEGFKSHNSILRNSLAYFPNGVNHFPDRLALTKTTLNALSHDALQYCIRPNSHLMERMKATLRDLRSSNHDQSEQLNSLLRHAELILRHRDDIEKQINALLSIPTTQAITKIYNAYSQQHDLLLNSANRYRIILYTLTVLLLFYIIWLVIRLRDSELEAKRLLADVNFQRFALDQHAIVVITDTSGIITYVNDKFCASSQYTRKEAIGHTHSILNSGHHPDTFFKHMWATISQGKTWSGEIKNCKKDGSHYWVDQTIVPFLDESGLPERYVGIRTDITERKQAEEQIRQMAYHDHLTGLPNRALFYDRLQQDLAHAHRNKKLLAVLMLDLDHFKPINDELGHEWGDKALIEVSKRLLQCTRATDTAARLGGDEFSIILVDVTSEGFACKVAEKVITAIKDPLLLKGSQYTMGVSIGICLASAADPDMQSIVSRADSAMYQAKESGRNCYRISEQ